MTLTRSEIEDIHAECEEAAFSGTGGKIPVAYSQLAALCEMALSQQAEIERLTIQMDAFLLKDGIQMVRAEMAEDELEVLEREYGVLTALLSQAEAALEEAVALGDYYDNSFHYPCCGNSVADEHKADCVLRQALAAIEDARKKAGKGAQ